MSLIEDLRQFYFKNKSLLLIILLSSIFTYGYFVANWAISIDSEDHTFSHRDNNFLHNGWISQGRFLISWLNVLDNYKIIPYWNDLFATIFIFTSGIIWLINLAYLKKDSRSELLIFALIFLISPIYTFYLRFTSYNLTISLGMTFASIASYYFIQFISKLEKKGKINREFLLSTFFVACTIGIYQVFATYWLTCALFIISYKLANEFYNKNIGTSSPIKDSIVNFIYSIVVLLTALALYKLLSMVIYHIIQPENYTNNFIQWGKNDTKQIFDNLRYYFNTILFNFNFNFFMKLTLMVASVYLVSMIFRGFKNFYLSLLILGLIISPFLMTLALGTGMPLRTLQALPLMLASIWAITYISFRNKIIKSLILITVIVSTFFNAQYIVRIFYSDNMRLLYDINYANRLYNFVLFKTGNAIVSKPLAIVGSHSYPEKPFTIKAKFDTISHSFFEWDGGNYGRMYEFMQWLGNEYILPSPEQQKVAIKLAIPLASFPDKNSIKEFESLIVLKLE